MPTPPTAAPYDAVLLLSFGGPEAPEEVVPFLENVTRGRGIPAERLAEVGEHYFLFGGRSPLNDQNRAFLEALRRDFSDAGLALPVYWGNRNWHPFLVDTVRAMRDDGIRRAAVFVTSAFSSYSSCRQYRENLADARADVVGAPRLDKLRPYFNHPGFLEPVVDAVHAALAELSQEAGRDPVPVFVTHSLPRALAESSGVEGGAYEAQHRSVMAEVCARLRHRTGRDLPSRLAFCSRSGPPQVPWLEPDVNDVLSELAAAGASGVVLAPIGFVSDHMEVVYDLDTQAAATARELALPMARAATPGLDPRFVGLVRELVLERAAAERGDAVTPAAVGSLPARPLECPDRCCAPPVGRPGTRA